MKKSLLMAGSLLSINNAIDPIIDEFIRDDIERMFNDGLTDREVDEGYFMDPVYGKCNIKKVLSDRAEAMRREYEAFNIMHSCDGTLVKSDFRL